MAKADVLQSKQAAAYQGDQPKLNADLQAESVAYLVSQRLGLQAADQFSFDSLRQLPRTPSGLKNFELQLATIQKEAAQLITRINTKLETYQIKAEGQARGVQNNFQKSLEEAKQTAAQKAVQQQEQQEGQSASKKEDRTLK